VTRRTGPWPRERLLTAVALAVSLVATAGSLTFSGVPVLGWQGMGLAPCELCWYQRILMYPLVVLLGLAAHRRSRELVLGGLTLAVLGSLVAAYHSLIQYLPSLEAAVCSIGSCTAKLWMLGPLSIPNLSLLAFVAIAVTLAVRLR